MSKRILLVDDDPAVQAKNKKNLEREGYTVRCALTLAQAREKVEAQTPDAIVLDRGMPDGEGLNFLRDFRQTSKVKIPVLVLSGYNRDENVVEGFDNGCDDYLTKPYTFEVLLTRLRHLLISAELIPDEITKGSLTLKPLPMIAYVNGVDLELRPKEYSLLQYLAQNENTFFSTEQLYEAVWGQPMSGDSGAVKTSISRLRSKLPGCGYMISTDTGSGYRFERGEP